MHVVFRALLVFSASAAEVDNLTSMFLRLKTEWLASWSIDHRPIYIQNRLISFPKNVWLERWLAACLIRSLIVRVCLCLSQDGVMNESSKWHYKTHAYFGMLKHWTANIEIINLFVFKANHRKEMGEREKEPADLSKKYIPQRMTKNANWKRRQHTDKKKNSNKPKKNTLTVIDISFIHVLAP